MKPAAFTYHRPGGLDEALALMARFGANAKPLAGGQSLGPMMNMRLARPEQVIDLNDLIELDFVRVDDGAVEIGALTRHHRVATDPEVAAALPLLAQAAQGIGHYAIRQRGTLGGSLVHADPAAQIPLLAVTLGAEVVVQLGPRRTAAAGGRFRAVDHDRRPRPRRDCHCRALSRAAPAEGWAFELFSRRAGDFALASLALTLRLDAAGAISDLRLGVGGVGPVPTAPAQLWKPKRAVSVSMPEPSPHSARLAAKSVSPDDEAPVPAAYRRDLVETLTARALIAAAQRTRETIMTEAVAISLIVNGETHDLVVPPRKTLADALREDLAPHRHPCGLRARRLRRLHPSDRRGAGARLSHLRGADGGP